MESPDPTDLVFVCPGTCQGASTNARKCTTPGCSMLDKLLEQVEAVYLCPTCTSPYTAPGRCPIRSCQNALLECHAVVPSSLQLPILDPPEEQRSYSSIWNNNEIGTGHARSKLDSAQGWSAATNDADQWMVIDIGMVVHSISGIVLANRKDGCFNQLVTQVSIDVKVDEDPSSPWMEVVQARDTGITDDGNMVWVPFGDDHPVPVRFLRIRPSEWENHISLRCALMLHGGALEEFRNTKDIIEYRMVPDPNQFPLKVAANFVPGGLPPPALPPRPFGVAMLPSHRCQWAGRQVDWRVLEFNGLQIADPNARVFGALPGQRCSIQVGYHAWWNYNSADYCPGCIVQLYYGMASTFCTGVVQHGIHNHRGTSRTEFVAPREPGIYYITQSISLMYNYVDNLYQHRNTHQNAFAVVRVLPVVFTPQIFPVLSRETQRQFLSMLAFSNREDTSFSSLDVNSLFHIFSFLLGQDANRIGGTAATTNHGQPGLQEAGRQPHAAAGKQHCCSSCKEKSKKQKSNPGNRKRWWKWW